MMMIAHAQSYRLHYQGELPVLTTVGIASCNCLCIKFVSLVLFSQLLLGISYKYRFHLISWNITCPHFYSYIALLELPSWFPLSSSLTITYLKSGENTNHPALSVFQEGVNWFSEHTYTRKYINILQAHI